MFSKRIFDVDVKTALMEELRRQHMTIRDLADATDIPAATLYKITSGKVDPRFSTMRRIVSVLEPFTDHFIAVIAAKFLLDEVERENVSIGEQKVKIKGYSANSLDECIIASVRAEKEGALGIICAPILASIVEKIVDIPVAIIKPGTEAIFDAIDSVTKRIE